jgi:hypothetical protein
MIRTSETIGTVAHEMSEETVIEVTEAKVETARVMVRAHMTFG